MDTQVKTAITRSGGVAAVTCALTGIVFLMLSVALRAADGIDIAGTPLAPGDVFVSGQQSGLRAMLLGAAGLYWLATAVRVLTAEYVYKEIANTAIIVALASLLAPSWLSFGVHLSVAVIFWIFQSRQGRPVAVS